MYRRTDGRPAGQITTQARKRRTVYGRIRREVSEKLTRLLYDHRPGVLPEPDRATLADWCGQWLEMRRPALRAKTFASYSGLIRTRIIPTLGEQRLQGLRPDHVRQFHATLAEAGLAPRTVRYAATLLKSILQDALRLELIGRNPAEAVRVEAPQVERKVRAWTPGQGHRRRVSCSLH